MEIDRIRISPASALKKTAGTSNLTHEKYGYIARLALDS